MEKILLKKDNFVKSRRIKFLSFLVIFFIPLILFSSPIYLIKYSGIINPIASEYIRSGIEKAEVEKAECVIIELNTPGGLEKSMRKIVQKEMNAKVPVVVFIYPSGSRAASAGVFITYASHIAAMSPGTNIGAAHPVNMEGKIGKEMKEKITNDAVAYIKSIAEARGRNEKWAEEAIRKSSSISAKKAKEIGVIDILAKNLNDLINKLEGRKLQINSRKITLSLKDKKIKILSMSHIQNFLSRISDPNIAYLLFMIGFWGIFFEIAHPGGLIPGIVGSISLILALFAFHILPINYVGLILIIISFILFFLDIKLPSHGILTFAGIISFIMGSLMLINAKEPYLRISRREIFFTSLVTISFFVLILGLVIRTMKRKPITGKDSMLGEYGIAKTNINEKGGMVLIEGELWKAFSKDKIKKGEKVKVEKIENMVLEVRKKSDDA